MTGTRCIALAEVLLLLSSASSYASGQEKPNRYGALVEANTQFAFSFFRKAVAKTPDTNVLAVPISLSLDFAFLQNGASGKAKQEILETFHFASLPPGQINEQSAALRQALRYDPPLPSSHDKSRQTGEQLLMSSSLWLIQHAASHNTPRFRPEFLRINARFYGLHASTLPPRDEDAVNTINRWAAQQTGGKLVNLIDSVKQEDFFIVSTTWFKGIWSEPFRLALTHPGDFTLLTQHKKSVPMMVKRGYLPYLRAPRFQMVRLDYGHAAMYVFLPDEDSSLAEFEQALTPTDWKQWLQQMRLKEGYLELPRFRAEYRGDYTSTLRDLGVVDAMQSLTSFDNAVSNQAKLTRVLQLVLLNVDEKGTEIVSGGVIGGVAGGVSSGERPQPFVMIVNRPFVSVICDRQSGSILYLAAVVEP